MHNAMDRSKFVELCSSEVIVSVQREVAIQLYNFRCPDSARITKDSDGNSIIVMDYAIDGITVNVGPARTTLQDQVLGGRRGMKNTSGGIQLVQDIFMKRADNKQVAAARAVVSAFNCGVT